MDRFIAILDDEPDRLKEMVPLLEHRVPNVAIVTFDNAPDMILWLEDHLDHCILLALDHDLGPNQIRDDQLFDPGTGRDVVDFLATYQPTCPAIIHTTNSLAGPGMEMALEDAGWRYARVIPYDDVLWIGQVWIEAVEEVMKLP